MTDTINHSRRALFGGRRTLPSAVLRPPWALPDDRFSALCSGCGLCITVCPERILIPDRCRLPQIDFSRGECTFCRDCVTVCPEPAFGNTDQRPWQQTARIDSHCLTGQGVYCESCRDPCESRAIRFHPALGGLALPQVDADRCSGCGACVAVCPSDAIRVVRSDNKSC